MAQVSSEEIEKKVLALLFKSPIHIKAMNLNLDLFAFDNHKILADIIKKYVIEYKVVPTVDTLKSFCNDKVNNKNLEKFSDAITILDSLPQVAVEESDFYFKKLENFRLGRKIVDLQNDVADKLENHAVDFCSLKDNILKELLLISKDSDEVQRGFVYNNVKDRVDLYKEVAKGNVSGIIPFGMSALDAEFGGIKKSWVALIYSKTAGGKSMFALNVAYNAAIRGYNVLYVSIEMDFNFLSTRFDSLIGKINSKDILFGKLNQDDRKKFIEALKKQRDEKVNIWISDIPRHATISKIFEEIEIYKSITGRSVDLLIIDYANILEPTKKYLSRSEKYDYLFQELKELARSQNLALLTMLQESRESIREDLKNKNKKDGDVDVEGPHKIGLSNFAATNCEIVIRLKQDSADKLQNTLWLLGNKSRSGDSNIKIPLFCSWELSYIGDRLITPTSGVTLQPSIV